MADGDSHTAGFGLGAAFAYPAQLNELLGRTTYSVKNFGVSGQTVVQMQSDAATQIDPLVGACWTRNVLLAWGGTNDLRSGASSAATAYADYVTYAQARRAAGASVVAFTLTPCSDATCTANGYEAKRLAFNTSVRASWATFADGLVDLAGDSRIGDAGDELDLTYYQADALHFNATGLGVAAALVQTAIGKLP